MGNVASAALNGYSHILDVRPLCTRAITASCLAGFGDFFSQKLIERNKAFDRRRSFCMFFMGLICVGPSLYYWYNFLYKLIPGKSVSTTLKRLFFDQLLYSPFSTALFLTVPYTLEGKAKEVPNLWRSNYVTTLCSSICTWTPANFITFRFIPLKYSVLFVNCVSLFWNSYASWKGHVVKSKKTE